MERNDRLDRKCEGNNTILTIWNDGYTTDAASTNSTSKQRLVVDLDAHPGDGTYTLARGDNAIALFDIAGGSWVDVRNDHRVDYHVARDATGYRGALNRLPAFLDRVKPALVQYQAGMDRFENDPVGGIDGITEAFLLDRDRFVIEEVRARGIPLMVNLAGGYVRGASERLHVNTVRVMRDLPCHT